MKTAKPQTEEVVTNPSDIQIDVLFKKMQKDDKKEILIFHIVSDEAKYAAELLTLTGKMTILTLSVEEESYEPIQAEFVNLQRDNKKTVLKFNVATEDEQRVNAIYPAAGTHVKLLIQPQQMTIDDVPPHDGVTYNVEQDGSVTVQDGEEETYCDYCGEPAEDLRFLEMADYAGNTCNECITHEIKA